jgi:hypothetical protein
MNMGEALLAKVTKERRYPSWGLTGCPPIPTGNVHQVHHVHLDLAVGKRTRKEVLCNTAARR